jgi:hypothetical protein
MLLFFQFRPVSHERLENSHSLSVMVSFLCIAQSIYNPCHVVNQLHPVVYISFIYNLAICETRLLLAPVESALAI